MVKTTLLSWNKTTLTSVERLFCVVRKLWTALLERCPCGPESDNWINTNKTEGRKTAPRCFFGILEMQWKKEIQINKYLCLCLQRISPGFQISVEREAVRWEPGSGNRTPPPAPTMVCIWSCFIHIYPSSSPALFFFCHCFSKAVSHLGVTGLLQANDRK